MRGWRIATIAFCALAVLVAAFETAGTIFGVAALPRVGLWGMNIAPGAAPYTYVVVSLDPTQAADVAGVRAGDVIDMRAHDLVRRFWLLDEPIAGVPVRLHLTRAGQPVEALVTPKALDAGKRPDVLMFYVAILWMLSFAALLAWRKPESREVRLLSLTLFCFVASLEGSNLVSTSPFLYVVAFAAVFCLKPVAVILWLVFNGSFARPLSTLRRTVATLGFLAAVVAIVVAAAAVFGEVTLSFAGDAMLHLFGAHSERWMLPYDAAVFFATVSSVLAIRSSSGGERQRAVWALLPLALLFLLNLGASIAVGAQTSYNALMFWISLGNVSYFLAPLGLTYAALGRRLLDIGFVLNRAVIFAIVSAIIVGAFILVEWAANEWLAAENRAAGAAVAMVVALSLGLSMHFIHHYVDRFVDRVFFRKRHEDEAALRRFGVEAAHITDRDTLVRRCIAEVRAHASATQVQLYAPDGTPYASDAGAPESGATVDENDPALVALRTWKKRFDLKSAETRLDGEYAFPMVSRGRLVGALVCGPKSDGESYAPDELDALAEVAHGVGIALDVLSEKSGESNAVLTQLASLAARVDGLYALLQNH